MHEESRPFKILVVDDDDRLRAGIRRWLLVELGSVDIGEAADIATALRILEEEAWDIVLLDIAFPRPSRSDSPRKTGLDALKEMRARDDRVPVVVVSGLPANEYRAAALASGARAFVQKERLPEELRAVLASLVARTVGA